MLLMLFFPLFPIYYFVIYFSSARAFRTWENNFFEISLVKKKRKCGYNKTCVLVKNTHWCNTSPTCLQMASKAHSHNSRNAIFLYIHFKYWNGTWKHIQSLCKIELISKSIIKVNWKFLVSKRQLWTLCLVFLYAYICIIFIFLFFI